MPESAAWKDWVELLPVSEFLRSITDAAPMAKAETSMIERMISEKTSAEPWDDFALIFLRVGIFLSSKLFKAYFSRKIAMPNS